MIITIDGPAASGKSTIARKVAAKLNFYYLYTGAMYRAIGWWLVKQHGGDVEQIDSTSIDVIQKLVESGGIKYTYSAQTGEKIIVLGNDITPYLKTAEVDDWSSVVSSNEQVRHIMVKFQRDLAKDHDVVVDGRDTGSVVFPQADCKIFLTASIDVRVQRWTRDQKQRGNFVSQSNVENMLNERDERDKTRPVSPLIIPEGATVIDSSNMLVGEVVDRLLQVCQK
ncbi:(d)CMP kinase [bacterium]|jgi:CMP/dCMP kinase|nr:(d)CMP kinase [bacterium]MBT3903462.1 (d)CMP kinase [bacterium]MBT4577831.1 (d)CMP kinase [bacterium]MBT5345467.1 (d)CMP kinase [bacterium]MBT6131161.1 (d)CMP kinase [bacterium]